MRDLDIIEKRLKEKYQNDEFSVRGYKEGAVCLEKHGDNWIVYKGFRKRRKDPASYRTLDEAYKAMDIILVRGF